LIEIELGFGDKVIAIVFAKVSGTRIVVTSFAGSCPFVQLTGSSMTMGPDFRMPT